MTASSITLIIFTIVAMNIVWDYPWLGVFAACVSMLGLGWALNWIMHPRLQVDVLVPSSAVAGEEFTAQLQVANHRRLPAIDFDIGFSGTTASPGVSAQSAFESVSLLPATHETRLRSRLRFDRRGVYDLPDIR
ncbi:MAG: hypothetical protein AAGA03_14565, partial [Planctomycetota bacterium]